MKIAGVEIKREKRVKKTVAELVAEFLVTQEAREITARMARSEVKNYLAGVAERAEVPFDGPENCLRNVWNLFLFGKQAERPAEPIPPHQHVLDAETLTEHIIRGDQ